jgi:hypothetical protein
MATNTNTKAAKPKATKPNGKAKAKATKQVDAFGFGKGTRLSKAAAMAARAQGVTAKEWRTALWNPNGDTYNANVFAKVRDAGGKRGKAWQSKRPRGKDGRQHTSYHLAPPAAKPKATKPTAVAAPAPATVAAA